MDTLRDISIRFFKLTLSQKSAIAGKLNLLEEEDGDVPLSVEILEAVVAH